MNFPKVEVVNQPVPPLDPYMAILYTQFLERKVWLEMFTFSAIWNTLLAGASGQPATTTIDPSIDFIVQLMNLTAYSAGNVVVASPDLLLEVQETSGRSNWSDGPIHIANWTGNTRAGGVSYAFPTPRYVRGNNTINWKLTNLVAGTAYRVDLAISGMRVTYSGISRETLFNIPF